MKKVFIFCMLMTVTLIASAQFTKEKLETILTGQSEKSWSASSSDAERNEKTFTFSKNYSAFIQNTDGNKKTEKWSLKSTDNIRWFVTVGTSVYELIVSYDKNGDQYLKLNFQAPKNLVYELKLVPSK